MASADNDVKDKKLKTGRMEITFGLPLKFVESTESSLTTPTLSDGGKRASVVGGVMKAYRAAASTLLKGRYENLSPYAPEHLRVPCNITVISCSDGIVVRYEIGEEGNTKVRSGAVDQTLSAVAPFLSDGIVHFPADFESYDPGPNGPTFEFARVDYTTGQTTTIVTFRPLVYVSPVQTDASGWLSPPHRPPAVVSMTHELDMYVEGEIAPADPSAPQKIEQARPFVVRSTIKLPVGWVALEIFPPFDEKYWKPEYAAVWAEMDLLASVARRQLVETQFATLDPNAPARERFKALLEDFKGLLDGAEEPAHQFLKSHPEFLSPTHLAAWSKLPFGKTVSDFVFREPDGQYELVEIEAPIRELFRKDGQQRQELTHAFNQILDWRGYIEENIARVRELGLSGISVNPNSLIVIGRSSSLTDENRRKLQTLQNQIPRLRILTYDDVLETAKSLAENLFGPLELVVHNAQIYFLPAPQQTAKEKA